MNQTRMKNQSKSLLVAILSLTFTAQAQPGMRGGMGGPPAGPQFGGDMAKLFGETSGFSATLEMHSSGGADGEMTMPGKIAFLECKSRFEMDMTQIKSSKVNPQMAGQMKQMGMGEIVTISSPDKKAVWMVYPGMQAYVENPVQDASAATTAADYKSEETELGKETVDGHACVKKKVVVTGKDGKAHESTVWSATDLKGFPVKIETNEGGQTMTMSFKDVKLEKPDAAQFEPPADFKKYDNMMTMMQTEMMKRMGGGRGMPVGQP
jgi:outer membrane lipoprotein-sorting protein